MRIYNTLTLRKDNFAPLGGPVKLYVCGITPYDTTHLGHAFTYVAFDVLARYLEFKGYPVRYVQNVTDVDDDILRRAGELGMPWNRLAQEETASYLEDMAALNVRRPDVMPRASEEVPKIVEIVDSLLATRYAYISGGNVYFEVAKDPEYGKLSRLARQQMLELAKERGGYPEDPRKKDALDFVLWQASAPGEPSWDSPWGKGRPGWHIECSAMSLKYLGEMLDIHGGGNDLVFPHHESEIAQSEHHTCKHPFSRFWVHTGMVRLYGIKMSKSLGNLVMVHELLSRHTANALRVFLLGFHYREGLDYKDDGMERAELETAEIEHALENAGGRAGDGSTEVASWRDSFSAAMDDDMDTPKAIGVTLDLAREVNRRRKMGQNARPLQVALGEMAKVMGLVVGQ